MPIAMGSVPINADMVVIIIGRNRITAALTIASSASNPSSRCRESAKSTIIMAFFFTSPTSMIMQTNAYSVSE